MNNNKLKIAECLKLDQDKYPEQITTNRLYLKKTELDRTVVSYSLYKKDNEELSIGSIVLLYDGEIWCKLLNEYQKQGYMTEAMESILETSHKNHHYASIERTNTSSKKLVKRLGFHKERQKGLCDIYVKNA